MHPVGLSVLSRAVGIFIVLVEAMIVVTMCRRGIHQRRNMPVCWVLGGYNCLVLASFLLGLLRDDGYGWAFVLTMIATLPWSMCVPMLLSGVLGGWFPATPVGGLLANFVIFVVICGGMNSALLYFLMARVFRGHDA